MLFARVAAGTSGVIAGLFLAQAIAFSFDGNGEAVLTYAVFYGAAALFAFVALLLFIYQHRSGRGKEPAGAAVQNQPSIGPGATFYGDVDMGTRVGIESAPERKDPPRPQLKFLQPSFPEATVKAPPEVPGNVGKFFVARVANDPPAGVEGGAALNVRAYFSVARADGEELFTDVPARWEDKPQLADLSPYQSPTAPELSEMNLPPNGAAFGINTFVYLRTPRQMGQVRLWTQAGLGNPIKAEDFTVSVRVRGNNVDTAHTWQVTMTPDNPFDGFVVAPVIPGTSAMRGNAQAARQAARRNPYFRANELQYEHERKKLREAMRCVGEDELANLNKPRLEEILRGNATGMQLATAQWALHGELIRQMPNPEPYRAAAAAYRALRDLGDHLGIEGRRKRLNDEEVSRVRLALADVNQAIEVLRANQP
jgi:hypothetical protein